MRTCLGYIVRTWWTIWECDGNPLGIWWKDIGNKRKWKKTSLPHPNPKGKNSRSLECMQSFPGNFPQSFALATCNFSSQNYSSPHCCLPGLMASVEFWGHILMTSTNQLTCGCHCLQQWMKQLFTWAHWYLVFIKHYLANKGLTRSTKYILNG